MKLLARALAVAMCWLPLQAFADEKWAFEFEFTEALPWTTSRLFLPACTKVVPIQLVQSYAVNPRPGWEISCGNNQPMFTSWLGRQIGQPLPHLKLEFGWRHLSSPMDSQELEFDSIGVRGRFSF